LRSAVTNTTRRRARGHTPRRASKRRDSTMKRLLLLTAALAVLVPSVALGDLPLKITDHGTTCVRVNNGTAVECAGKLSGLGGSTANVTVTVSFACTNRGGNQPPGQASGQSGPIPVQNGQLTFDVTTSSARCPDDMAPTFGPTATISVSPQG